MKDGWYWYRRMIPNSQWEIVRVQNQSVGFSGDIVGYSVPEAQLAGAFGNRIERTSRSHQSPYRNGDRRITGEHVKTLKTVLRMNQGFEVRWPARGDRHISDMIKIAECLESEEWEIRRKNASAIE